MNIYKINKEKFKSIYFSVNYTMPIKEKDISKNAVLSYVLAKSCEKYKTQKEMEKYLDSLYGANFDINIEKYGDLYNFEFRIECINKEYLPNKTDVVRDVLDFLFNVIYKPNMKDNKFDDLLVEREKMAILDKINQKKDDKLKYGVIKMEELMSKGRPSGEYIYGNIEEVECLTSEELFAQYLDIISKSCITVIVSGNLNGYDNIDSVINDIFRDKLNSNIDYSSLVINSNIDELDSNNIEEIIEEQQTTQSVITLGLKIKDISEKDFFVLSVYNSILGVTPSSKLFQNVREKESLAYTARSRYYRFKDMIIIYAGIERKNYEKAKQVITYQIEDMKNGKISDEEFESSKESIISDLIEWNDSKIALAKMLIANLLVTKDNNMTLDYMIDRIKEVKIEDVIAIANKIDIDKIFLVGGVLDA